MKKQKLLLFLAGLGSVTEIHLVGSLAITELFFFAVAPILLFKNYASLKRDGFLPIVMLTILICFGCILSGKINGTPSLYILKGIAVPAVYFVSVISLYSMLRRDLDAMKWFWVGNFLSGIISIFIFQQETFSVVNNEVVTGVAATENIVNNALFLSSKINSALRLPLFCMYTNLPSPVAVLAALACGAVSMFLSEASGRSSAAAFAAAAVFIFLGGRSRKKISRMGKHLCATVMILCVLAWGMKVLYSYLAEQGALGETAQKKYEYQARTGGSIIGILMTGRMEFFCGMQACIDHPIIGLGPRALDKDGYVKRYIEKYATYQDLVDYVQRAERHARLGFFEGQIPAHSHIVYFWLYYGIFGLIIWLYVFWLMYKYLRNYAPMIPQWYGYMCVMIPTVTWNIFFSPPGGRLTTILFIVCLLFSRAIYNKKIQLPLEMEIEARVHD